MFHLPHLRLALATSEALARETSIQLQVPAGTASILISLNVPTKEEADATLLRVKQNGGSITRPGAETPWGGYAGFFTDPDGHPWEVVWNPKFTTG